jgi:hypothetical protein
MAVFCHTIHIRFPDNLEVLMSEVPRTLTELKTEFGKTMLLMTLEAYDISNESSQHVIINAPHDELMAVADEWRAANLDASRAVGLYALQSLARLAGDAGSASATNDSSLTLDFLGIEASLSPKADYLIAVFDALHKHPLEDVQKCLRAVAAFGNGE